MNIALKCVLIGGMALLAQMASADMPGNIEVCFTANYTFADNNDYIPQRYRVKLSNGTSEHVQLPTPSAYQGWFGMNSNTMPETLTVTSDSMSAVQCQMSNIAAGSYVSIVVDYGSGTIPINCSITASKTSSPCQGHNVG